MKREVERWIAVLSICAVGCTPHPARPRRPIIEETPSATSIQPPPASAPHGGRIRMVALTDRGDAALTDDDLGELRLWPTLDGVREPVIVDGPKAGQLALGRDGDGLCAAILDLAGNVELRRFDPVGRARDRVQLPDGAEVLQVAAVPGGVLVRRADHSLEQYDVHGAPRGRLLAGPSQRIAAIAVRRDHAIAAIAGDTDSDTNSDTDSDGLASFVRSITLRPALAWGPTVALPQPLGNLALAPGGKRFAGTTATPEGKPGRPPSEGPSVLLLELRDAAVPASLGSLTFHVPHPQVFRHGRRRVEPVAAAPVTGFVSDELLIAGFQDELKWARRATPSWRSESGEPPADSALAATDTAVIGDGASLLLETPELERTLGYRWVAPAEPIRPFRRGHGNLVQLDEHRLWLDDDLEPRAPIGDPDQPSPELMLDDDYALFKSPSPDTPIAVRLEIRKLRSQEGFALGIVDPVDSVQYDPATHVLAVQLARSILRYRLSFSPLGATPLRPLGEVTHLTPFVLTDPAQSDGVVAVTLDDVAAGAARVYRLDPDGDRPGALLSGERFQVMGEIQAVDRHASIYVRDLKPDAGPVVPAAEQQTELVVYARGHTAPVRPASRTADDLGVNAVSHGGGLFASVHDNLITVFDAAGAIRWQRATWDAGPVAWTEDDRSLLVAIEGGGLLSIDTRTGARRAMRCGWGFGLSTRQAAESNEAPSPCDAAMRHGEH